MNVDDYIDSLPEERRIAIRRVRELVNSNLPPGYEEGVQYGMISWFVPFTTLAETYNNQPLALASLASQKQYMSLYLMSVYGDPKLKKWFEGAFKKAGKKLDMGKSCVRFKSIDDLPLEVIGEAISRVPVDEYVRCYHEVRANMANGKKPAAKKAAAKKPAAKAKPKAKAKAKAKAKPKKR